jgi:hypothetical protein
MPSIELKITMDLTTHAVRVDGNIGDKVAAYGLLEAAKDAIQDYHTQQQRLVQPITLMPKLD